MSLLSTAARSELLRAEIALRRQEENVAAKRRALPLGGEISEDYAFDERDAATGAERSVTLSELFDDGKETLFLYGFMFIPGAAGLALEVGCPSCTSIIDAVDGEVRHIAQRINFVVVAKAPIERFRVHAESRGWRNARVLSSASTAYNADYQAETPDGSQLPIATVFTRRDGRIHHVWSSELRSPHRILASTRVMSTTRGRFGRSLDCTPEGRGAGWGPSLEYS